MSAQHDSRTLNWHYTELDDKDLEIRGRTLFFIIVLFSIILLITVLFLYTRWVCRYHSQHQHHRSATSAAAQARHAPPSLPPQGLDLDSIKKLPIILHQAPADPHGGAWEETECCICLGEFSDGEKVKVLPVCGHCFHCDCVDKWLTHHSTCPICRASVKVESSFPKILIEEPPIRIDIQF